jgi:hypothetical protein
MLSLPINVINILPSQVPSQRWINEEIGLEASMHALLEHEDWLKMKCNNFSMVQRIFTIMIGGK